MLKAPSAPKTKEMLGLVASMVLVVETIASNIIIGKCHEQGISTTEIYEIFAVANIVGGYHRYSTYTPAVILQNIGKSS